MSHEYNKYSFKVGDEVYSRASTEDSYEKYTIIKVNKNRNKSQYEIKSNSTGAVFGADDETLGSEQEEYAEEQKSNQKHLEYEKRGGRITIIIGIIILIVIILGVLR